MTKIIGYCTVGHHVRYVTVTSASLAKASARGRMVEGVCDSCREEQELDRENREGKRGST